MPDDAANRLFAEQYVTARQKFLDQAERMDLKVQYIDITDNWFGNKIISARKFYWNSLFLSRG